MSRSKRLAMSSAQENIDRRWEPMFRKLQAFQRRYGHCKVPLIWPANHELTRWVAVQRNRRGSLPVDQPQKLYDLGFDFGRTERQWLSWFFELRAFHAAQGHFDLREADPSLRDWAMRQRRNRPNLGLERVRWLSQIGFPWREFDAVWEHRFSQVEAFQRQHGHCSVPNGWPENPTLYAWVEYQRYSRRPLPANRIRRWPIGRKDLASVLTQVLLHV